MADEALVAEQAPELVADATESPPLLLPLEQPGQNPHPPVLKLPPLIPVDKLGQYPHPPVLKPPHHLPVTRQEGSIPC